MGTGELLGKPNNNCGEVTCDGLASRPGGVEILLAASCYGNRDKLRQHKPVLASRLHFLVQYKQYTCPDLPARSIFETFIVKMAFTSVDDFQTALSACLTIRDWETLTTANFFESVIRFSSFL